MSTVSAEIFIDHMATLVCRAIELQEKGMSDDAIVLLNEAKHMARQLDQDQTLTYFL